MDSTTTEIFFIFLSCRLLNVNFHVSARYRGIGLDDARGATHSGDETGRDRVEVFSSTGLRHAKSSEKASRPSSRNTY
jgi:hypothetical protein